jgi:hypothetical protein
MTSTDITTFNEVVSGYPLSPEMKKMEFDTIYNRNGSIAHSAIYNAMLDQMIEDTITSNKVQKVTERGLTIQSVVDDTSTGKSLLQQLKFVIGHNVLIVGGSYWKNRNIFNSLISSQQLFKKRKYFRIPVRLINAPDLYFFAFPYTAFNIHIPDTSFSTEKVTFYYALNEDTAIIEYISTNKK